MAGNQLFLGQSEKPYPPLKDAFRGVVWMSETARKWREKFACQTKRTDRQSGPILLSALELSTRKSNTQNVTNKMIGHYSKKALSFTGTSQPDVHMLGSFPKSKGS